MSGHLILSELESQSDVTSLAFTTAGTSVNTDKCESAPYHENVHIMPMSEQTRERYVDDISESSFLDTDSGTAKNDNSASNKSTCNMEKEERKDDHIHSDIGDGGVKSSSDESVRKTCDGVAGDTVEVSVQDENKSHYDVEEGRDRGKSIELCESGIIGMKKETEKECDMEENDKEEERRKSDNDESNDEIALKKMECPHCDYKGKYMSHLIKHMTVHKKKRDFTCKVCGTVCTTIAGLQSHMIVHSDEKPFECLVCGNTFKLIGTLRKHMLAHTNVKPATCDVCNFVCKTKKHLELHMCQHKGDSSFACTKCNLKFKTEPKLQKHLLTHTGEQPFHCKECSIPFWSQTELRNHLATHTNIEAFQCEHCDFKCDRKQELNSHLLIHTEFNPFTCSLCDFSCRSKSVLIQHTLTHMNDDDADMQDSEEITHTVIANRASSSKPTQAERSQRKRPLIANKCFEKKAKRSLHKVGSEGKISVREIKDKHGQASIKNNLVKKSQNDTGNRKKSTLGKGRRLDDDCQDVRVRRSARNKGKFQPNYCEMDGTKANNKAEEAKALDDEKVSEEHFDDSEDNLEVEDSENEEEEENVMDNMIIKKELDDTGGSGFDPIEQALLEGRIPHANVKLESAEDGDWPVEGLDAAMDNYLYQLENKRFYCKHCQYSCATVAYLKRHMKTHTDLEFEACPHCEYFCKTAGQLKEHMVKHSDEGADDRPFPCDQCDFRSKTQGDLKRHLLTHLPVKPYSCSMCSYTCTRKTRLEEHFRIHSDLKPFVCKVCSYRCRSRQNLNSHMRRHSRTKQIRTLCPHCDYKALTKPMLRKHIMQTHTDKRPFACKQCSFTCWLSADLTKHEWIHKGIKPFECEECGYKCRRISRLNEHMATHKNTRPFKCNKCPHACRTRQQLKKHMEVHQGEQDVIKTITKSKSIRMKSTNVKAIVKIKKETESMTGNMSEKSVGENSLMSKDVDDSTDDSSEKDEPLVQFERDEDFGAVTTSTVGDKSGQTNIPKPPFEKRSYVRGPKEFRCTMCSYVCKKMSHLKRHMYCHTTERPYKCDKCEYSSKTEDNLRRHAKRHSGIKPYSCKLCNYRCYELGDLNQHLMIHTDFRAYKCPKCDYAARKKYHLKEHMMTHSDIKPFLCSECGDSFRTNSKLREHMFKHNTAKNIECPHCPFMCRRQSELNKHMKKHTQPKVKDPKALKAKELKPFLCPECGYSFKYSTSLTVHMTTHTGEKPWPCPHCSFRCRTKGQLQSHLTKHMESKPLACEFCAFTCKHESSLRRHRLMHTCTKPIQCQFCDFTCVRNYDIKRHVQNKHKMKVDKVPGDYPHQLLENSVRSTRSIDNVIDRAATDLQQIEFMEKQMEFDATKPTELMEFAPGKSMEYVAAKAVDFLAVMNPWTMQQANL